MFKKMCKYLVGFGVVSFIIWQRNISNNIKDKLKLRVEKSSNNHMLIFSGFYKKYVKRPLDFLVALLSIIILFPLMSGIALAVRLKLGRPVFFTQSRPGLNEKIFKIYKFRTMTDERGKDGELLSDSERLTKFGEKLRSTSFDELPELINILKGEMSLVGPRPQLVKDMVFMCEEHRKRHRVRPGLTGLAQINGRNAIDWEKKLDYDIDYCKNITFMRDIWIICKTIKKVLIKDGITEEGEATASNYGDYLLLKGKINQEIYDKKLEEAQRYLKLGGNKNGTL